MFLLVPTIATLLLCGGGLWEGERGLTFHSKVVSGIDNGLQYQATSVSINLDKNRKSSARAYTLWFHLTMVLNHISPCLGYGNV